MALAAANAQLLETRKWEEKAQGQFLDVLSHELRTPLTSIMGFAQIIRRRISSARDVDSRVRDQLDLLWGQAQRLNRLLDTFVDMSTMERGEFAVEHNRLDVAALLTAALDQSLTQSRSAHRFSADIPDQPIWIFGDAKRLEHVFGHVLSNALRYSPEGQPIAVTCKLEPVENEVLVSVTDRGPGIPPEMQKEIFKRFYPSDARRSGGMGVGLYVSRAIVDAHGGRLSLESSPGRGTSVHIHLPA
jgi:signal transduction histidine kinase